MNARAVVRTPVGQWNAVPLGGPACTPSLGDVRAGHVEDDGAARRRPVLTAHWVIDPDGRLVCRWLARQEHARKQE